MTRVEDVFDTLRQVRYPGLEKDIVSLGYVTGVGRVGERLVVSMEIGTSDAQAAETIEREARRRLDEAGYGYELQVAHPQPAKAEPAPEGQVQFVDLLPEVTYKIAVASGKGGVGKSTVAVNLALALAELGAEVGLLDADVYGPSMPTMLGSGEQKLGMSGEKVVPPRVHGIRVMSLGFLTQGITPIIWRGPLAGRAIEQLMTDVDWSGVEYLVFDLPPGTGDVQISLSQKGNLSGAVVVTTPQDVALIDAIKGVGMFQKVDVPVLGIVENMTHFECPHCHERSEIFPQGKLKAEMERLGVPVLGDIPIDPQVATAGDAGKPILLAAPDTAAARAFRQLAVRITEALKDPRT
jgi:ATP-binding protein involved in chromosome partitioning